MSIFAASSPQVQELGNWEFSPKRALFALPDLLVTARGSCRVLLLSLLCFAVGRSDCLLHHGALKSFCCALGVLGQKLHFICFVALEVPTLPKALVKPPLFCYSPAGQHQPAVSVCLQEV